MMPLLGSVVWIGKGAVVEFKASGETFHLQKESGKSRYALSWIGSSGPTALVTLEAKDPLFASRLVVVIADKLLLLGHKIES